MAEILQIHAQIEQIFRREHGRVLATLISRMGDFSLAEDALQDALVIALEKWPIEGLPDNPGAWLTTIARRRAIDRTRKRQHESLDELTETNKLTESSPAESSEVQEDEEDTPMDSMSDSIPDDRLKLMFTCCHPSLAADAQVALTLRTLGGLSTAEIARAFLVPVTTMAQRLQRAKLKIRDAGIPYRVPPAYLLPERLDALLTVLYLIFNEGYVATSGDEYIKQELCHEAIRLCRALVELLPNNPLSGEARGLLALMLLHDSRRAARAESGELVILEDQDRSLWDQAEIREGLETLDAALGLGKPGPYQLQAAISALHAQAPTSADTDWRQIVALYYGLAQMTRSAIVEVNRAVAIAMLAGPNAGLHLLYQLADQLSDYFPYHAARADLLRRANQREAATDAYQRALDLCQNNLERTYLQRRLDELLQ